LEYAGNRCEVVHHCPFNSTHADIQHSAIDFKTVIKTADQPLDLSRLMFAVGHPSMFRRIMFACLEQNPVEHAKVRNYGQSVPVHESYHGDIYLDSMGYGDPQWTSPASAQEWILAQLKAQGVHVTEN
jgi:hypothetical protein